MNFEIIKDELDKVNYNLQKVYFPKQKKNFKLVRSCLINSGKRIRPALAILSAKATGHMNNKIIKIASLVEIIHLASLLHDDVIDNVNIRRGKPSINAIWGNKISVIIADYFISKGILELCKQEYLKCIEIISNTVVDMSLGQLKELLNQSNLDLSIRDYMDIIEKKTATFFSSACQMGTILAGASKNYVEVMRLFGLNFGMAYQLVDDLLDFWGDTKTLGKPTGNDILQKNFTLPLIYCFFKASKKEKDVLAGDKNLPSAEPCRKKAGDKLKSIIKIMDKYNTKDYVQNLARNYSEKAISFLSEIKNSPEKLVLKDLTLNIINRKK